MQTNNKMAVAPVGKLIWQMSIPPLISMFLQYSYNLIDSAFVARLSENALTAVSLSFPITTLMNATSIWIGVGVNVLIAGYLGEKKQDEANTTVTHGLLLAFGVGALLNLLSLLIMKPYFRAFTNNEEIYQLSLAYNYGAGNRDRLHSAFRYGTALVSGMMILGTLTVNFFPAQLLELFTASEAMRSFGISAMRIMAASYLFCGLSTMISTYFQATEKVGSSIAIQLCRQLLFLVPALWCLNKLFQLNGIWLAFPVAETATMLIALIIMAWHRHKNIL